MNNQHIQHIQHNQNKITKKIFINTFYISLLAIIGLCFNVFSYNDIGWTYSNDFNGYQVRFPNLTGSFNYSLSTNDRFY